MKKFDIIKTIQLLILIMLTVIAMVIIIRDGDLYQMIAHNIHVKTLCGILWIGLGISYVFLFIDMVTFSNLRKENHDLDFAVFTDPLTGVANRNSCDAYIEQYQGKKVPEGMGCATVIIKGLKELNDRFGHERGDQFIREFAELLSASVDEESFVGRNGGIKFLVFMPEWTPKKWRDFENTLNDNLKKRNESADEGDVLSYIAGVAYQGEDNAAALSELVSMSDKRAFEKSK